EDSMIFTSGTTQYKYSKEASNKAIADPIWNLLDRGGKRWRPVLFLLIAEALSNSDKIEDFLDFVVIPEVVHNGTLMVDDIEDSSDLRRGKPCIHKIFGNDIAINAGNAMYFLPLLTIIKNTKLDDKTARRVYDIYSQEMINISFGQAYDIAWHKGIANADDITEQEYLQMCAFKTGTLARMSAKLAAALTGADDNTTNKIGHLAESIGIGFQIQDDILNLTATSGENQFTEEYLGSDISEGKRTLMVIYTLKNSSEKDKQRLLEILKIHTKDKEIIKEAISIIKNSKAIDYAKQRAKEIAQTSWNDVKDIIPENTAKNKLESFVNFLVERDY
ncbi:hypothetical protein CL614_04195, partial [archaeon]|nr:hypothetical protein [archaeon]